MHTHTHTRTRTHTHTHTNKQTHKHTVPARWQLRRRTAAPASSLAAGCMGLLLTLHAVHEGGWKMSGHVHTHTQYELAHRVRTMALRARPLSLLSSSRGWPKATSTTSTFAATSLQEARGPRAQGASVCTPVHSSSSAAGPARVWAVSRPLALPASSSVSPLDTPVQEKWPPFFAEDTSRRRVLSARPGCIPSLFPTTK